jgi:hypothetical protein
MKKHGVRMKRFIILGLLLITSSLFGQTPFDWWTGFEGGTNGAAPTTTSLAAGSYGNTGSLSGWSVGNLGPGLLFSSSAQLSNFVSPISVEGTNYSGSGNLGLQCTTATTGANCGPVEYQWTAWTTSASVGFWLKWSCPATLYLNCGALGGIYGGLEADYAVAHVEPPPTPGQPAQLFLEAKGGHRPHIFRSLRARSSGSISNSMKVRQRLTT